MLTFILWPTVIAFIVLASTAFFGGFKALTLVAILALLEVSLSFDNAIVNATILTKMPRLWQRLFLSLGIIIAVFGARLALPLLLVGLTAHIGPLRAIALAMHNPDQYSIMLQAAHPAISAFGGAFLLMIFLDFIFETRDVVWLRPIERKLSKIGEIRQLPTLVTLVILIIASLTLGKNHAAAIIIAGGLGLVTYLLVDGAARLFEFWRGNKTSGLFLFMCLEILDTSFSLDGVIGAFAVTNNIFFITAGLGIGAVYVRSLTTYLVRKGTISKYIYLEHGAHYAIGALAVLLFITIDFKVPEILTGLIGVSFIAAAFASSLSHNKTLNL